jgi:hypothetical protein
MFPLFYTSMVQTNNVGGFFHHQYLAYVHKHRHCLYGIVTIGCLDVYMSGQHLKNGSCRMCNIFHVHVCQGFTALDPFSFWPWLSFACPDSEFGYVTFGFQGGWVAVGINSSAFLHLFCLNSFIFAFRGVRFDIPPCEWYRISDVVGLSHADEMQPWARLSLGEGSNSNPGKTVLHSLLRVWLVCQLCFQMVLQFCINIAIV